MVACIYSPLIKSPQRVSNEFMYVTDILPTLAAAANITINDNSLDGVSQWETISAGSPSPRREILYNIENDVGYGAVMHEGWKIVNGTENMVSEWIGSSGFDYINVSLNSYVINVLESEAARSLPKLDPSTIKIMRANATVKCENNRYAVACVPSNTPCLFNIVEDPCEQNNLAASHPLRLNFLENRLQVHLKNIVPTRRRIRDPHCDPANFNFTWSWWEEDEVKDTNDLSRNIFIYVFGVVIAASVLSIVVIKCNKKSQSMKL